MKVRYTPRARSDRRKIFDYISAQSPLGAANVLRAINKTIATLADNPDIGQATSRPRIMTYWVSPYRYRIFYRINHGVLVVAHIRHTSRRQW